MFKVQITDFIKLAATYGRWFNLENRPPPVEIAIDSAGQKQWAGERNRTVTETHNACGAARHAGKQLCANLSKAGEDVKPLFRWLDQCNTNPWKGFEELKVQLREVSLRPVAKKDHWVAGTKPPKKPPGRMRRIASWGSKHIAAPLIDKVICGVLRWLGFG